MTVLVMPICLGCRHFERSPTSLTCAAFSQIPADIIESRADHRRPFPGDGGITFAPATAADAGYADRLFTERSEELDRHLAGQHDQASHGHGGGTFPGLTGGVHGSPELEKAIVDAEREVADVRGGEVAIVIATDGTVISRKQQDGKTIAGGYTGGEYTDGEIAMMGSSFIVHNHPMGYDYPAWDPRSAGNSLSGDDIRLAANANAAEIRAVGPKATYILRPSPGAADWGDRAKVDSTINIADASTRWDFTNRINNPTVKDWGVSEAERIAHAEAEHWNEVVTRAANAMGWQYEVVPR